MIQHTHQIRGPRHAYLDGFCGHAYLSTQPNASTQQDSNDPTRPCHGRSSDSQRLTEAHNSQARVSLSPFAITTTQSFSMVILLATVARAATSAIRITST